MTLYRGLFIKCMNCLKIFFAKSNIFGGKLSLFGLFLNDKFERPLKGGIINCFNSFCPLGRFVPGTSCPLVRFVPWDVLSLGKFCPLGSFVAGTFCICAS